MITLKQLQIYFTPNKKLRSEIVNEKVSYLTHEILIHDFSNEEIALILKAMQEDLKHELKRRKAILEDELVRTTNAINKL